MKVIERPMSLTVRAANVVSVRGSGRNVVLVGVVGPQGIQGIPGPQNLFVQPNDPSMTSPGLWVQTQIGTSDRMTFWIEDGR